MTYFLKDTYDLCESLKGIVLGVVLTKNLVTELARLVEIPEKLDRRALRLLRTQHQELRAPVI